MIKIPQKFITKGVEATEAAKKAVAKIENSVKQEVITPSKLVREPDSDLFEKASYMTKDEFWNDYSNSIMNEANRHRLGLPVSEEFAKDTLVFDEKTGRVKQHIYHSGNGITNFAEDGRTPISEIRTNSRSSIETVEDFKTGITKEYYNCGSGRKILEKTSESLPEGGVRYTTYANEKPSHISVTDASGKEIKRIDLDFSGGILHYISNGEKLI
jgi:hypothetical protein